MASATVAALLADSSDEEGGGPAAHTRNGELCLDAILAQSDSDDDADAHDPLAASHLIEAILRAEEEEAPREARAVLRGIDEGSTSCSDAPAAAPPPGAPCPPPGRVAEEAAVGATDGAPPREGAAPTWRRPALLTAEPLHAVSAFAYADEIAHHGRPYAPATTGASPQRPGSSGPVPLTSRARRRSAIALHAAFLGVGTSRGVVHIFDRKQQLKISLARPDAPIDGVSAISFAERAELLAAGHVSGDVVLWDVVTGAALKTARARSSRLG